MAEELGPGLKTQIIIINDLFDTKCPSVMNTFIFMNLNITKVPLIIIDQLYTYNNARRV